MTTENMNRYELNDEETNLIDGAGLLSWRIPNFPSDYLLKKQKKETPKYKLPEMDVDNRPVIDPPKYVPKFQHA